MVTRSFSHSEVLETSQEEEILENLEEQISYDFHINFTWNKEN